MLFIETIASIIGISGFFLNIPVMIYIGGIVCIIEIIRTLITGELHSLFTTQVTVLLSIVISYLTNYNIFQGICFGLSVESVLCLILGLIIFKI